MAVGGACYQGSVGQRYRVPGDGSSPGWEDTGVGRMGYDGEVRV